MLAGSRARRGRGGAEIEEVEYDGIEIPDDAVVAMQLLRTQFPVVAGIPPVALVSQIYSLVKDRTSVDRQLDKAVRRQELRLFRLQGNATDNLAMHMDDFVAAAHKAASAYVSRIRGDSRPEGSAKRRKVAPASGGPSGERRDEAKLHAASVGCERSAGAGDVPQSGPDAAEVIDRFLHGVLPEHPAVTVRTLSKSARGVRGGRKWEGGSSDWG
jgi:hypothetical protein